MKNTWTFPLILNGTVPMSDCINQILGLAERVGMKPVEYPLIDGRDGLSFVTHGTDGNWRAALQGEFTDEEWASIEDRSNRLIIYGLEFPAILSRLATHPS